MEPRDPPSPPTDGDDPADDDSRAATDHGSLLREVASAPAVPLELAPGDDLEGIYQIVRRIGSGGMGVVYLARDQELQRNVAVKVHRSAIGTERLYREALAMAQLAHPNVVAIHGVGRVDDQLYIAMEYVPGDNLSGWLQASPRSWLHVLDVVRAVGEGLAVAHDAGFVHRDIKPQNILVGTDGRPRLGDFGLVRVARPEPSAGDSLPVVGEAVADSETSPLAQDLTVLGTTIGTPAYMAPEQLSGGSVDARADQFALCVVAYEALYGHRPWVAATVAELREQIARDPPREPAGAGVPSWVWTALRRGLALDPDDRYDDVRSLLGALRPPSRQLQILLAVAAALIVGAVAVATMLARGGAGPVSCDAAGTAAVAVWGPTARSKIAANYVRLDPQAGPEAANQLAAAIDAWSLRWQRGAVTSCAAIREKRWTRAIAAASQECFASSLAALRKLVAQAQSGRTLIVDVTGLPDVDGCADPSRVAPVAAGPAAEIAGHWKGDFGHLLLRRAGNEVHGVYEHDEGIVRGTLANGVFVGWWCETPSRRPPGDAGDVEMKVVVDREGARSIAGRWRYGVSGNWDDRWDLTWDPTPAPAALVRRLDAKAADCARP